MDGNHNRSTNVGGHQHEAVRSHEVKAGQDLATARLAVSGLVESIKAGYIPFERAAHIYDVNFPTHPSLFPRSLNNPQQNTDQL